MPAKFFALRAALKMTLLMLYSSISERLTSCPKEDVTPEFFDTVGVHGQHVSVLGHVPKGTDVGGVAPKEYSLRSCRQWWISGDHVLGLQKVVPAHGFRGGIAAPVPGKIRFK